MDVDGVEIVNRFRAAVANREFETAAGMLDPALTFYAPKRGVVLGRDELVAAWRDPQEDREHLTTEMHLGPVESLPDGRLFSTTKEINRWRESGELASENERAAVYRLDGDKIAEIRIFPTADAGRAAVASS